MLGVRLKALVYDILPLEAGAGKRCSQCDSNHWFTTSFLLEEGCQKARLAVWSSSIDGVEKIMTVSRIGLAVIKTLGSVAGG